MKNSVVSLAEARTLKSLEAKEQKAIKVVQPTKLQKALKEAKGVEVHDGKLRIRFKLPDKPNYSWKSLRTTPTVNNVKHAVTTRENVINDIANHLYVNDPDAFWKKHFPLDPTNLKASITFKEVFEEFKEAKVNYLSDSKYDKLNTALNWLIHFNLADKDLSELTTEKLEKIRQTCVKNTKAQLIEQRESLFVSKLAHEYGESFIKLMDDKEINKLRKKFEKENPIKFLGCAVVTVHEYTKSVKQVLDFAMKKGYVKSNPAVEVEKLASDTIKLIQLENHAQPFSQQELDSLLDVIHLPKIKLMVTFLAWTGLRHGELKALAWEDVDFEKRRIHVKYNLTRKGNLKTVKTKAGIRHINLLPAALDVLKQLKEDTYYQPKMKDVIHANNQKSITIERRRVFLSRDNQPYLRPELTTAPKQWANWLIKAGISHRPAYQLRHTYASRMLMNGARTTWLAEQMGHSDTGMIDKIYGKWIKGDEADYMENLAASLGQTY